MCLWYTATVFQPVVTATVAVNWWCVQWTWNHVFWVSDIFNYRTCLSFPTSVFASSILSRLRKWFQSLGGLCSDGFTKTNPNLRNQMPVFWAPWVSVLRSCRHKPGLVLKCIVLFGVHSRPGLAQCSRLDNLQPSAASNYRWERWKLVSVYLITMNHCMLN